MMEEDKIQGVMKDWFGNIAQDGDILHFVSVLEPQPNVIIIDPDTSEKRMINAQLINGPFFRWGAYYSTRVFEQDGILYCQMPPIPGSPYNMMPINLVYDNWKDGGQWDLGIWICIERNSVGDEFNTLDERDFFRHFFRREISNLN